MRCPYCAEAVHEDAIVCPHCHRDFSPMKPMMRALETLSARVEALEQGRGPRPSEASAAIPGEGAASDAEAASVVMAADQGRSYRWKPLIIGTALLVAGHFLIIIQLDLALLWLRGVSIAVPLVCGFVFRRTSAHPLWVDFVAGLGMAVVAIAIMVAVVARIDGVPLLPRDVVGWREIADYTASISLAFFAGALVRQCVLLAREPDAESRGAVGALAHALLRDIVGKEDQKSLEKQLKAVEAIITSAFAVCVAIGSVIAGIGRVLK